MGKRIGQNKCINIPFDPEDKHHQYIDFIKFIKQYAKKRELGERKEIQLARVSKSCGQPMTYNIQSQS